MRDGEATTSIRIEAGSETLVFVEVQHLADGDGSFELWLIDGRGIAELVPQLKQTAEGEQRW